MDVCLNNLHKGYDGRPVLTGFTARFSGGKFHCVMGPSGCGKTTLLHLILGLLTPDAGEILPANRHCAAVFQEDRLCSWLTARENVALVLGRRPDWQAIDRHLQAVGLTRQAAGQQVGALSGGMKRRVAIVRAAMAPSQLLVLDEPFQGLDADTRRQTADYLRGQLGERVGIVVTHDWQDIDLLQADCLLLSDGRALAVAPVKS